MRTQAGAKPGTQSVTPAALLNLHHYHPTTQLKPLNWWPLPELATLQPTSQLPSSLILEIRTRVKAALPSPADQQLHPLHPGHYVVIKDFRRTRWNQKRWQGPLQILLVTQTTVKVAERATWIHASHCKKVPEPKEPVCLLPNTWATVIVPLSSISNLENTAAGYAGNQWYMTNDQLDTGWHTLVADPPGQDWSSYTTTNSARRQRPLLTLTSTSNKLTLTVKLTKGSLLDDPDGSGCWLFLMWAWKDGTDPSFLLQLCVDRPNGTPIDPMPAVLSPKATSSGIKLVLEPTVDDYFEIMTGSVSHTLFPQTSTRIRRFADSTGQDSTYIDAIGIPRGVPDEYKW
ncbi:hypothetical protein D4764_01G0015290 [Takifugu flavidus]|uniref:Murine leukemia virus integrase C-terminal domain-containing protein n=1 Tax=Takifugu flavidus TaxID=433684 RepID=A0A5C6PPX4_9TELE|nr:hypothetical protein D4764_01G0015290 [Takifugu flavidus]